MSSINELFVELITKSLSPSFFFAGQLRKRAIARPLRHRRINRRRPGG